MDFVLDCLARQSPIEQFVILRMRPNPKPLHSVRHRNAERAMVQANSDTAITSVSDQLECNEG
jgi:hypothetical protein